MANITYVDANDDVIGYGPRIEAIQNGIIHRIARVFVYNSKGELLIQKRSKNHASLPDRWDQSAAGHVDEGEDYATAAARELEEEVGVSNVPLNEAVKFYSEETDEPTVKKRFNTLYIGHYDGEIKIDDSEVSEGRWIQPSDLQKWMADRPEEFTEGFRRCLVEYLKVAQ